MDAGRPTAGDGAEGYATSARLPQQARAVVVGGGIIGTSVAYHLARQAGFEGDVVVLERDQLTSGTTWHAAGLMVTFGSTSATSTAFRKYSRHLYETLEEETGMSTGFKPCGFIELATDPGYLEEFRRVAASNRLNGVDVREITPGEVSDLFPLCRTDDVLAGFYVEQDGRVNPVDATMAMAKGARMKGARFYEGVSVTGVTREGARVTGVTTSAGDIAAEFVINCGGMWARQLGQQAGVTVANQAAEHYYLITDTMDDVQPEWPVVEDPKSCTYIRPEGGGLMVGLFETEAAAWQVEGVPGDFSFGEIEPDWERMAPFLEKAMGRVPRTLEVGAKKFFCGPESFTPDLAPIIGEAPELQNYFVAAGLNSIGILTGGGVGRLLAQWVATGKPDLDVTGINVDRLHPYQANPQYRADRVVESLGMVYRCHYPNRALKSARGAKRSPLHEAMAEAGAYFRDVSGWESPGWFHPGVRDPDPGPLTYGRPAWFQHWEAEHHACRTDTVLIDMSFMSKFLVQGRDAGAVLNRLSTANVDARPGEITYTQWLNDEGCLEADLTVGKLTDESFLVVVTDTMHRHAESMLKRAIAPDTHAFVTDVTGGMAQINIQGPGSRQVLQSVTSEDMSNEAFPFRTLREIDVGYARVNCSRMTYVGELGYELFVPAEQAAHVYEVLQGTGGATGLRHAGLYALGSLRMEKAYRDYGHDMDNTDTLVSAGLGFTCDFAKEVPFVGQAAVQAEMARGAPSKRLLQLKLDDPEPLMYGAEVVYRDGDALGDIAAASYGHTLGGAVGLSMVRAPGPVTAAFVQGGRWEVDVAGTRHPATASIRPQYDPQSLRVKV